MGKGTETTLEIHARDVKLTNETKLYDSLLKQLETTDIRCVDQALGLCREMKSKIFLAESPLP